MWAKEDVFAVNEGFIQFVFKEVLGKEIPIPFRRLPYQEAMDLYGSDKPDTRFGLRLHNLGDVLAGTGFQVFAGALQGAAASGGSTPRARRMP